VIFYRIALSLAAPVVALLYLLRRLRGRITEADLSERLAGGAARKDDAPALWLHAASNGELNSARPLISALLAAYPTLRLIITTNSLTGRDLARGWNDPRIDARLAPLDYRPLLHRFLRRHRPAALLLIESDLWLNRIFAMHHAGLPVLLISARMSARSASRWQRIAPRLARRVMARLRGVSAQDGATEDRLRALGLPEERRLARVNLKAAVTLPRLDPAQRDACRRVFDRDHTVLAASTHPGEEEVVLDAFVRAQAHDPALRLILAPRHPRRGDEVQRLISAHGLTLRRRSRGEPPSPKAEVYLADTLGEMALWFDLASISFIGGSLVDLGGHTPYEPAQCGTAILHGPHLQNFAAIYDRLDAEGGARQVTDAATLAQALVMPGMDARAMAKIARRIAADDTGDGRLDELVAHIARAANLPLPKPPAHPAHSADTSAKFHNISALRQRD
jgi:3-deoxy-D-manno-octulosonic-acid transferase